MRLHYSTLCGFAVNRMRKVLIDIKADTDFSDNWDIITYENDYAYCFRVKNKNNPKLFFSVSTVKVMEWEDPNTVVLETALFADGRGVVYDRKLGYQDVCLHDDTLDLLNHLKSLANEYPDYDGSKQSSSISFYDDDNEDS